MVSEEREDENVLFLEKSLRFKVVKCRDVSMRIFHDTKTWMMTFASDVTSIHPSTKVEFSKLCFSLDASDSSLMSSAKSLSSS